MGKKWSTYELDYITSHYKTCGNLEMSKVISRSASAIKRKLYSMGLRRAHKELRKIRVEIAKRPNAGQYVKGSVPHNTKYNGHERITKDGYVEIRIKQGRYKLKHLHLWEQVNGSLPGGCCLRSLDGDKLNTDPDNWRLITRIENMYLNSKYKVPQEVIPSLVAIKQLDKLIQKAE